MDNPQKDHRTEMAFARLGRDLSATASAVEAARQIVDIADELIGWDACYLILYDPALGGKPRPLLTMDTINGKKSTLNPTAPDEPSVNMQRAIREDGFLSLHDAPIQVDRAFSFGTNRRTVSHLFVPVRSSSRTIGVFSIQSYALNAYNLESLELFKALANQCAGALERIWAQEALAEVEARRAILYKATHEISASLEIDQLYEVIYKTVLKVMPCNDFIITGYDANSNEVVPLYIIEEGVRLTMQRYTADHGLTGKILHTGKSYILNTPEELNNSGIDFVLASQTEDATNSIVAVPMVHYGKVVGMISAQSYKINAYTKDDQQLLELLATHAAIAIENANLFSKIQQMADLDPLTGIFNRRKFYMHAEREFTRAHRYKDPLSVIMMDVDEFKKFNDNFGHKVGDFVLQIVAEQCKKSLRDVDIFGRHGGEEFIALLPSTKLESAQVVAERLRARVQDANLEPARKFLEESTGSGASLDKLKITVSVGLATCDDSCTNIDLLVDHADRAMYKAKNSGKNKVVIWDHAGGE
jgi:diguanylate cyclase (GGDEF)-like protein